MAKQKHDIGHQKKKKNGRRREQIKWQRHDKRKEARNR